MLAYCPVATMADSEYDYDESGSDDEYVGAREPASSSRVQVPAKRKRPEKTRHAWERERGSPSPEYQGVYDMDVAIAEGADKGLQQSAQEREEDRKRKRYARHYLLSCLLFAFIHPPPSHTSITISITIPIVTHHAPRISSTRCRCQ